MVHLTTAVAVWALASAAGPAAGPGGASTDGPWPAGVGSVPEELADTTFALERGQELELQNLSGRVTVETWERDEVRIEMDASEEGDVQVRRSGAGVVVRAGRRHEHGRGRYLVSVPAFAELSIHGSELDVSVRGVNGGIDVRTGEGNIEVRDAAGPVAARSVEGRIWIVNVDGPVSVSSGDEDVVLTRIRGPVVAQTVDGDIRMDDIDADRLEATAVDGDVRFSGTLARNGEYRLGTHDGDLIMELDGDVDANMVVSTFDGDFESEFLVTMDRFEAGKALRFTLGRGGAQVALEVFDGNIQLRRR